MSVLSDFLAGVTSKAKAGTKKVSSFLPSARDWTGNTDRPAPVIVPGSMKSVPTPTQGSIPGIGSGMKLTGDLLRAIPVTFPTKAMLTFNQQGPIVAQNKLEKFLLGSDPVQSYTADQEAIQKWAKDKGLSGNQAIAIGAIGAIGEAGLDFFTGGKGKTVNIVADLAKANTASKVSKIAKQANLPLSKETFELLAKETDPIKVSSLLNIGIEDSNFRRSVTAGLSQRAAVLDKEIAAMEKAGVFPKAGGPLEKAYIEKTDISKMLKDLPKMDNVSVDEVGKYLNFNKIDPFKINEQGLASGVLPGRIEIPKVAPKVDPLLQEARKYKSAEEFINSRPNVAEYSPLTKEHVDRSIKLLNESGVPVKSGEDIITLYHGTNVKGVKGITESGTLNPFSYLATDKNASKGFVFGKGGDVLEIKVPVKDAGFVQVPMSGAKGATIQNPVRLARGEDGIWRAEKWKTKSQLTDLWKEANKTKTLKGFVGGGKLPEDAPAKKMANFIEGIKNAKKKESVKAGKEIVSRKLSSEVKKDGFLSKLSAGLNPKGSLDAVSQKIYQKWARGTVIAREYANSVVKAFKIPEGEGMRTILDYQAGKANKYTESIREAFDGIFKEANERLAKFGKSVEYQKNYLPQVYKNSPEEIKDAMASYMRSKGVDDLTITKYLFDGKKLESGVAKTLKLNPSFVKEKAFPDYATAMRHGLTPRFTHPGQLFAYYRGELEKTVNNMEFLDSLQKEGRLSAIKADGLRPITGPDFLEGYYAKPELARLLNNLFKSDADKGILDSIISGVAFASRKMQEIALSGGIPRTSFNFFTIGQMIKEMTSGNFKPIVAFIRSNFDAASMRYFEKNVDVLQAMARNGINLGDRIGSYETVYKNIAEKFSVGRVPELLGEQFDKAFNKKTFASFMPQMYTQVFKDAMNKGLKKGMSQADAEAFAGDVTKAAFGLFEDVGRSKGTEDALSATFFAPKFREGIIRTLANAVKSVTTEIRNPAFYKNRRLVAGMAVTYAAYNALNYKLNGHYMWDNPSGKEFDLMIPTKNKNEDVVFIGFMPSFLAFARNMASGVIATGKGDFNMATQKFGGLLSMPMKITSEVLSNSDYFGRQIYKDTDDGTTKLKKIAAYIGLAVNHPAVKAIYEYMSDKSPLYQAVSKGIELPLKFSTMPKIYRQQFYEAMDKQEALRAKEREAFKPRYEELFKKYEENPKEAMDSFNALSPAEKEIFKSLKSSEKRKTTQSIKEKVFPIVKESTALYKAGKKQEAIDMYNALTEEEKKVFKSVKKSAGL